MRRRLLLMIMVIVVMAGAAIAGLVISGSGSVTKVSAPYPLNIPVAKRTPAQLAQGRLMLPAHLAAIGQILPLSPSLASDHLSPLQTAEVRLATTLPTLSWTTGASVSSTLISVASDSITMRTFTVAALAGGVCWYMQYSANGTRYGETTRASGRGCVANSAPKSGWQTNWLRAGA